MGNLVSGSRLSMTNRARLWLARARRAFPSLVWYGDEVEVRVTFREAALDVTHPMQSLQDGHLAKVERDLAEIGIEFDKGVGAAGRDWEWDWSLRGPISVSYVRKSTRTG